VRRTLARRAATAAFTRSTSRVLAAIRTSATYESCTHPHTPRAHTSGPAQHRVAPRPHSTSGHGLAGAPTHSRSVGRGKAVQSRTARTVDTRITQSHTRTSSPFWCEGDVERDGRDARRGVGMWQPPERQQRHKSTPSMNAVKHKGRKRRPMGTHATCLCGRVRQPPGAARAAGGQAAGSPGAAWWLSPLWPPPAPCR
jgi:hypothetical protein